MRQVGNYLWGLERAKDGKWTTTEKGGHVRRHIFSVESVMSAYTGIPALRVVAGPWKFIISRIH